MYELFHPFNCFAFILTIAVQEEQSEDIFSYKFPNVLQPRSAMQPSALDIQCQTEGRYNNALFRSPPPPPPPPPRVISQVQHSACTGDAAWERMDGLLGTGDGWE
jgi:hypothetical protein